MSRLGKRKRERPQARHRRNPRAQFNEKSQIRLMVYTRMQRLVQNQHKHAYPLGRVPALQRGITRERERLSAPQRKCHPLSGSPPCGRQAAALRYVAMKCKMAVLRRMSARHHSSLRGYGWLKWQRNAGRQERRGHGHPMAKRRDSGRWI